jgi:peptidoglycan glycosyltransferase
VQPHLAEKIGGRTIHDFKRRRIVSPAVDAVLKQMLTNVVDEHGATGNEAQIPGYTVGGKTGTAQNEDSSGKELDPHGWFIGFAYNSKGEAVSAVCVMLENVSGSHESAEAARMAGLIMKAAAGGGS